ncbi:SCO5918 family protein [Streptomyces sp. P1-3]|uniref:SCO5918 family protein n=1 Tax=Streptomyces sp. P1-3 TaxID=3421658 RepID=UPI003D364BC4
MRCIIAGYPFDLTASEVEQAMSGIKPEPIAGECVVIGRRSYPVKQVGAVVTRQDRRDFTAFEVTRAMRKLGFTCRTGAGV